MQEISWNRMLKSTGTQTSEGSIYPRWPTNHNIESVHTTRKSTLAEETRKQADEIKNSSAIVHYSRGNWAFSAIVNNSSVIVKL